MYLHQCMTPECMLAFDLGQFARTAATRAFFVHSSPPMLATTSLSRFKAPKGPAELISKDTAGTWKISVALFPQEGLACMAQ